MIVQDRQGVAAASSDSEVALEVHLPEVVGLLMLEAVEGAMVEAAGSSVWPRAARRALSLRAPQAGCSRRKASNRSSTPTAVRRGEWAGRRERSAKASAPPAR